MNTASANIGARDASILTAASARPLPPGAAALGSSGDRQWARLGWADAAALSPVAAAGWDLAFLDEATFLAGTVGFTAAQIRAVVETRVAKPPQTYSAYADELGESAGAIAAWSRNRGGAWERNAEKLFLLLREAFFTGRFRLGGQEDISQLLYWRTGLASLERELGAHKARPAAWAPVLAALDPGPSLRHLAEAAAHLGQPAYTLAPAVDEMPRLVHTRGTPEIADRIERNELPAEPWAGAFLIPLAPPEIRDLHPFKAIPVFATVEDYQRSFWLLSREQRQNEINARLAAGGLSPREYLAALVHVRLVFLAYLDGHRIEAAAGSQADPAQAARLDAVFAAESEALARLVSLDWGEASEAGYRDRIAALRLKTQILIGFADRAGASDTADLMDLFAKTLAGLEPV